MRWRRAATRDAARAAGHAGGAPRSVRVLRPRAAAHAPRRACGRRRVRPVVRRALYIAHALRCEPCAIAAPRRRVHARPRRRGGAAARARRRAGRRGLRVPRLRAGRERVAALAALDGAHATVREGRPPRGARARVWAARRRLRHDHRRARAGTSRTARARGPTCPWCPTAPASIPTSSTGKDRPGRQPSPMRATSIRGRAWTSLVDALARLPEVARADHRRPPGGSATWRACAHARGVRWACAIGVEFTGLVPPATSPAGSRGATCSCCRTARPRCRRATRRR